MQQTSRHAARRAKSKLRPVWLLAILDILLAGLVLCVFAMFHHVIPRLQAGPAVPIAELGRPTATPEATVRPTATMAEGASATSTAEPTPEPTPERPLTMREKFAEHFTDTVEVGEDYYTSPNISVTITQTHRDMARGPSNIFVADIYIADVECFRAAIPSLAYAVPTDISKEYNAVVGINGDTGVRHSSGLCVRNGLLYVDKLETADLCVMFYDGSIETYEASEITQDELLEMDPYQIWNFGPELLEDDGTAKTEFGSNSDRILAVNPRTGLGYYEPGHYCFVVVDGRDGLNSVGAEMAEWAQLFEELGCTRAYNMDGGGSSTMVFQNDLVNNPSSGQRRLTDMIIIQELPDVTAEEDAPGEETEP